MRGARGGGATRHQEKSGWKIASREERCRDGGRQKKGRGPVGWREESGRNSHGKRKGGGNSGQDKEALNSSHPSGWCAGYLGISSVAGGPAETQSEESVLAQADDILLKREVQTFPELQLQCDELWASPHASCFLGRGVCSSIFEEKIAKLI